MDNNEHDSLQLELENFTCDLLALTQNQPALQKLFLARKGSWVPVRDLCSAVPGLTAAYRAIQKRLEGNLWAVWLDSPTSEPADGYAVVLFFLDDSLWSTAAVFNRNTLPGRREGKPVKQAKAAR